MRRDCDSFRVLSASRRIRTISYVDWGSETRERESRSSIWISVTERSCATSIFFNFSGWEESEGGERRRVRFDEAKFDGDLGEALKKSDSESRVTDGAMMKGTARRSHCARDRRWL